MICRRVARLRVTSAEISPLVLVVPELHCCKYVDRDAGDLTVGVTT